MFILEIEFPLLGKHTLFLILVTCSWKGQEVMCLYCVYREKEMFCTPNAQHEWAAAQWRPWCSWPQHCGPAEWASSVGYPSPAQLLWAHGLCGLHSSHTPSTTQTGPCCLERNLHFSILSPSQDSSSSAVGTWSWWSCYLQPDFLSLSH